MARINPLLFSAGITFSLITFFGCGGETTSTAISTKSPITPKTDEGHYSRDHAIAGQPSDNFKKLLPFLTFTQSNCIIYEQVENSIQQNTPINLTLEYINTSSLYHAILKSNNTIIGENFIYINTDSKEKSIELLTQLIDNQHNRNKIEVNEKYYYLFDKIWDKEQNQIENSIIRDSIKNNPFNATQDYKYTVNFTLQKPIGANYQLSNIQISGLTVPQTQFELKNSKDRTLLALQSTLTTLFANFEKSKEIFN